MQKHLLLYLLLLTPFFSFTQNWAPINTTEVFNFRLDQAQLITHSLWVDSSMTVAGDSLFFMNRIMEQLDDCSTRTNGSFCDTCCYSRNGSQFMGRELYKRPNGAWVFTNPDTMVLFPQAGVGFSWLMDSTLGTLATVSRIWVDQVYGQTDSLKTLSLSNGDSIRLSKSHGMLRFPSSGSGYHQAGIEGRNLGEQVPDFWDFYDFQVGDQMEIEYRWENCLPCASNGYHARVTITNRQVVADTITFSATGVRQNSYGQEVNGNWYYSYNPIPVYSPTFVVIDSATHLANLYPNQPVQVPQKRMDNYLETTGITPGWVAWPDAALDYLKMGLDANGNIEKQMGFADQGNWAWPNLTNYANDSSVFIDAPFNYHTKLNSAFGPVRFDYWDFETSSYWKLKAFYGVEGDTLGVITADSVILGRENFADLEARIYPNPVADFANVELPEVMEYEWELLSINGTILDKGSGLDRKFTQNVEEFASGIYILKIKGAGKSLVSKLIKR